MNTYYAIGSAADF